MRQVIADTGFWVALANPRDAYHEAAKAALDTLRDPLVTTWPVMVETCHLLLKRLSPLAQETFITSAVRGAFAIFPLGPHHLPRIVELMERYRDLPMDLADASLVILAEETGSGRILSTDRRDFEAYRWKRHEPFDNLLPEEPDNSP